METRVIEQLDLNALIMALVSERLEAWKESHKEYDEEGNLHMKDGYDEVHCDVKELAGGNAGELDRFISKSGKVELRIVEVDFLEKVK